MNIAIIDDQEVVRYSVAKTLKKLGHNTFEFTGIEKNIVNFIKDNKIELLIVDIMISDDFSGIDLLKNLRFNNISNPAILMTAYTTPTNMIEASKIGVKDILQKPFSGDDLTKTVEKYHIKEEKNIHTLDQIDEEFVGSFETMKDIYEKIGIAANNNLPVMIQGDTGSGKELIAHLIHKNSTRSKSQILAINCASIPKELFESQFFGHEKGAFTDAVKAHIGFAENVGNGTLFLDEIGELDIILQSKLLRFLETKTFRKVGSNIDLEFKGRIVAATNIDLNKYVENGQFREDLFYRLSILNILVPSLEERKNDIPILVQHFIKKANYDLKLNIKGVSNDALEVFKNRAYKGNIRELKNLVYNCALNAHENIIQMGNIKNINQQINHDNTMDMHKMISQIIEQNGIENSKTTLESIENAFYTATVKNCNNISHLATYLHISRSTLRKILEKYAIEY